ncbi:MAG: hypothetical protein ICV70_00075 [Jiangellaceae bacterium]|nr:hypothetical protein [Jiangellaceae bacterium]
MKAEPTCPRCGGEVHPPGLWSNRWTCAQHGEVYPLHPVVAPSARLARQLAARSAVPLWLPWPMPRGWVVSAIMHAGDDVSGTRASGVAVSGPHPLGGPADLLLVAEEPGVGLGARYAGMDGSDPGDAVKQEPQARLEYESRPLPLWWVDVRGDCAVYVGQWAGDWLWAIFRPNSAGILLLEDLPVEDVRDLGHEVDLLPYGTPPPWLTTSG